MNFALILINYPLFLREPQNALAYIEGVGYATEILEHNTSISAEADCFQKAMKMALQGTPLTEVDVIVMHAPGTIRGDLTEMRAIEKSLVIQFHF